MVGSGSGKRKWFLGVLPSHVQAVLEPSQGYLVDILRRARGDSRRPLAIRVSQRVEEDFGIHRMDPWPVDAVLQGEVGGQPLPVRHRARDGHCPRAGEVGGERYTGGVPAGPAPRRISVDVAPGLLDPVVPGGAEPPCFEVGGVPLDVGVAVGQLVHAQRPTVVSAPAIMLTKNQSAVRCSLSHAGPLRWCTTRCTVCSSLSSSERTAMSESCGTSVGTSRAVQRGSPRGLRWPAPNCTITHSAWSCACSVARAHWSSVVTNHTGVGARGPWHRCSGHATSAFFFLVLAVREYVAKDVQEGRWWVVCRPLRGGGQTAPTAVAPDVEVQAVRGHSWASVNVMPSPRGLDKPQAGVPRFAWCGKSQPKRRTTRGGRSAPVRGGSSGGAHRRTG